MTIIVKTIQSMSNTKLGLPALNLTIFSINENNELKLHLKLLNTGTACFYT